jgi:hypothetical protein
LRESGPQGLILEEAQIRFQLLLQNLVQCNFPHMFMSDPCVSLSPIQTVQPLSVVDNSDFSPTRLTFPLETPYSTFSEGNGPCSSFQAERILHEPACVLARVLPHLLSRAALCPLLALSRSCPGESSCQDTQQAPTSPPAPLPRRLPCLSSRLHSLLRCRASACACATLE